MKGLLILVIIIFLVIGVYIIINAYNLNLEDKEDVKTFIVRFGKWLFQVGKNVKDVTGYAAQQKWLPAVNETNDSNKAVVNYIE